ncbi:MAG: hypothetical protein A2W19_15700 [Spirochaetes bacterium RBG_16_49_21]|nr:MAG: hypothetical protein A2W19_15700 [Spirochaetes bacterium RBG_16_49_21]
MARYDFDLIVIGCGGAGITAATLASGLGKKTAMVDKKRFGGECTWTGCVPSKALIQSARMAYRAGNTGIYGLELKGKFTVKRGRVMESVRGVVDAVYKGEERKRFESLGITAIENADVRFEDPHTLRVSGEKMTSSKFLISTGSGPLIPPIKGMDKARVLTNETLFSLKKLARSMIILGAGPIGVEMAMALNRLGVKVTLVEMGPEILPREDREIAGMLAEVMKREGVNILTGARAVQVSGAGKVALSYESDGALRKTAADSLLVAVGRRPHTGGLNLEAAGVLHDSRGVAVNRYLQTSAQNIYAAGDVVGPYQFSHIANYQAIVATSNALLPLKRRVSYEHVAWCIFTDPELARSGMTEQEAVDRFGGALRVYRVPYGSIDRAATDRAHAGLAKFICSADGTILGVHILGERAGELLHEPHAAKSMGIKLHKLNSVIHVYPTYNDIIRIAARQAYIDKIRRTLIVRLVKLLRRGK